MFLGVGNNDDDGAPADVDDEDIDFLDHADRFEKAYNFRCESGLLDTLLVHMYGGAVPVKHNQVVMF